MEISELTRRDILDYLLQREQPFHGRLELMEFLEKVWDLDSMPSTDSRCENAAGDIYQHMFANSDWEDDHLLYKCLDIMGCEDDVFLRFVETCLHPVVVFDREQSASDLQRFNDLLEPDGYRLEVHSRMSGRPVYRAARLGDKGYYEAGNTYEVVLSFAGEDREYIEKVAQYLSDNGVKFFYDRNEEVDLWGKELTEHLDRVYR